ncbi:MAG: hypothetical protein OXN25_16565 [Candidatus Poribacteria bacterium]|nr:hypothetical protein [Candidatus Poribacteria bacterium]
MRVVVYTAGILIVLAVAWTFYLNHSIKKFESNLSETIVMSETQQEMPAIVDSKNPPETEVSDEGLASHDALTFEDSFVRESEDIKPIVTSPEVDIQVPTTAETVGHNEETPTTETVVGPCGEVCEPSRSGVDFHSLSKSEQLQFMQKGLVKRFGDVPEVDLFIDYMKLSHNKRSVGEKQALEYVRAVATLFPNEANKKHLRELEVRVASRPIQQKQ